MTDFFFQIILSLVGILISILGQIVPNTIAKRLAAIIGGTTIIVAILWIAYEVSGFGFLPNKYAESDGIIWNAIFYGNKELKEPITLQTKIKGARNGLRVNWGVESPKSWISSDFFSAIFTTTHNFNAGRYCFTLEVDDGARLFIDGTEARNAWWGYTPGAVYKTPVLLSQGAHKVQLYYYEEFENSSFHLYWYENVGSECVTVGHPGVP